MAIVTACVSLHKRIRLINKQHTAHCLFNDGCGFHCRLSDIACNKTAAVCFDHPVCAEKAIFMKYPCNDPGNFRFARSRISQKAHMQIGFRISLICYRICLDFSDA